MELQGVQEFQEFRQMSLCFPSVSDRWFTSFSLPFHFSSLPLKNNGIKTNFKLLERHRREQ